MPHSVEIACLPDKTGNAQYLKEDGEKVVGEQAKNHTWFYKVIWR